MVNTFEMILKDSYDDEMIIITIKYLLMMFFCDEDFED